MKQNTCKVTTCNMAVKPIYLVPSEHLSSCNQFLEPKVVMF